MPTFLPTSTASGSSLLLLEGDLRHLLREGETRTGILIERDAGYTLPLQPVGARGGRVLSEQTQFSHMPPERAALFTPDGRLLVTCILQKSDTLNRNGRVYPHYVLERENRAYQLAVQERMASGECNHPDEITLDLHNLSHLVVRTWWEGKALMGELEILVSPQYVENGSIQLAGDKIAYYLEKKMKLGISSRGLGSVKKVNGQLLVQSDFSLIGFDLVQSPSTPGSYLYVGGAGAQSLHEQYQAPALVAPVNRLSERLNRFGGPKAH
jgi:hypothetical protein